VYGVSKRTAQFVRAIGMPAILNDAHVAVASAAVSLAFGNAAYGSCNAIVLLDHVCIGVGAGKKKMPAWWRTASKGPNA